MCKGCNAMKDKEMECCECMQLYSVERGKIQLRLPNLSLCEVKLIEIREPLQHFVVFSVTRTPLSIVMEKVR